MFSLSYTPAYDPYHTVFRYLVLLTSAEDLSLSYKAARSADFFLCFPWALKDVRAPQNVPGFAKSRNSLVKKYPQSDYDRFPSSRIVFERMELIQATAVSALAGADMIDPIALQTEKVSLIVDSLSTDLQSKVESFRASKPDLVQFLASIFPKIGDLGKDGIYARSGLGEFSYDVI
ncbi:hypothetical protein IMCC20628_03852 [Hoeflea sp. IMCC20628]|nr:hypothetical protein IMCC20628_03852 [Hoeflea sp. IMCC20628]